MKISKTMAAIAVGLLVVFVVSILYLYNRDVRRIERIAVAEIRAKVEKEQEAKRKKERAELEEKLALHEKAIIHAVANYNDASAQAVKERLAKEAARKANASLNATWEVKYGVESKAHAKTIEDWAASDKRIGEGHFKVVIELNGEIATLTASVLGYQKKEKASDKTVLDLKSDLALEKRKGKRRFGWGPFVGIGIDKKPVAGAGVFFAIGRIG